MDPVKIIIDSLPEGVLKELAERDLILVTNASSEEFILPEFSMAAININLHNLTMRVERFIEHTHWWIDDGGQGYYDYYTAEELDTELSYQIAKSILWVQIEK
jgi:hypothetical protein